MRFSLLLLLTIAATADAAQITLREEATTSAGALVLLGDVATVTGDNAERLSKLPLMPNPSPGTRQFVSAASVRAMLAAQGESPADHRYAGAYRVRVETPALASEPVVDDWQPAAKQPIAPSSKPSESTAFRVRTEPSRPRSFQTRRVSSISIKAVREAVREAVQSAINNEDAAPRLAVRNIQLSATAIRELVEMGDQPITVEFLPRQPPQAGSITVRVWPEARRGGEAFNAVADLVEQPMRVVTRTPVARGTLVTASAVRLEPIPMNELDRPQAMGYTELEQVVGREAKRPLRLGEVLSDNNTAAPLMVRRSQEVEVISGGGGVSVSLVAQAKQDGRQGDLITVQLLDRKEEFTARVVGPRQLAVLSARGDFTNAARPGAYR